MLKVLHTADWHLGHTFRQFDPEDGKKLARARLAAVDTILGLADQYDVHAVLCAGDVFDVPDPDPHWWKGLAKAFARRAHWKRPLVLLPGNHDPLTRDSVYHDTHQFRAELPPWVHVVDRDDFCLDLPEQAVVLAAPCRSTAGDRDLALALPPRAVGDVRIRIGLAHGSTFDLEGYQTNFPIARDAAEQRGLDYLAIGDTHGFREIPDGARVPTVYPGTPEQTSFKEREAGHVALVTIRQHGHRARVQKERVARWRWREETVRSLAELEGLAQGDLAETVLRLRLDMRVDVREHQRVEAILAELKGTVASHGRAGVFNVDRSALRVEASGAALPLEKTPEVIQDAASRLEAQAATNPIAARALLLLHRVIRERS
jgi:DNA repair exonuclease SbcCD nuclease subunit